MKKRVLIGHLFTVLVLLGARHAPAWQAAGAALVAVGILIRIWAAGCLYKDQIVCTTGPYRHLRNPLYLGSFLIFLGFVVATAAPWTAVAFLLFFPYIYGITILSEEKYLLGKFPEQYGPYFRSVPRFLPRPTPAKGLAPSKPFRWEQVTSNKEYEGAVGSLVVLAVLLVLSWKVPASVIGHLLSRAGGQ